MSANQQPKRITMNDAFRAIGLKPIVPQQANGVDSTWATEWMNRMRRDNAERRKQQS